MPSAQRRAKSRCRGVLQVTSQDWNRGSTPKRPEGHCLYKTRILERGKQEEDGMIARSTGLEEGKRTIHSIPETHPWNQATEGQAQTKRDEEPVTEIFLT